MQRVAALEPLYGLDRAPLHLSASVRHEARRAVDQHRAGAPLAALAPWLGR